MIALKLTVNCNRYIAYMIIDSKTQIVTCSILMCNSVLRIQVQPEPNPLLPN